MNKQRCFLALLPQPMLHKQLFDTVRQLKQTCSSMPFRWTRSEQYHLTVKFLGNLSGKQISRLDNRLKRTLPGSIPNISASVSKISLFPNPQSPRVLAAIIEKNESLQLLYQACQLPDSKDSRDFQPHITLAYCKSASNNYRFNPYPINLHFEASQIHLIASELTSSGPIYRELNSYPLPPVSIAN